METVARAEEAPRAALGQWLEVTPSRAEAHRLAGEGRLLPLYREILADVETPVSAYLKVARGAPSFLLESVEGGERLARYSIVGTEPSERLDVWEGRARLTGPAGVVEQPCADPLALVDEWVGHHEPVAVPGLPRFHGGAVGYLAYEIARCYERLPSPAADPLGLPLACLALYDSLLVFDHLQRTIKVVTHVPLGGDVDAAYDAGLARIEALVQRLATPLTVGSLAAGEPSAEPARLESNMPRAAFEAAVVRGKEHIAAGDIIQVVLAQRFSRPVAAAPFAIYRALRAVNPSPYMYFLDWGEFQLVGASPELLVMVENGQVVTNPIAGTRPRGATPERDAALAEELRADEKERAEHLMLVDLGRNDIGRVSAPGSVRVPQFMEIERYSHVMHLVSQVTGRLDAGRRPVEALRACFPAGTVSGAPKIRAMEIIAELEPERRGAYAGAVGFFGYDGGLETAITIRTAVIKDGVAHATAGAGIVADSVPATEYEETLNKARAIERALELAERLSPPAVGDGTAARAAAAGV
ncbi:MAG TPA: anthranilate synthase component I [Chloroflexota bacterium]|nr:anthranilate synthase component I [Chloroflexota bacterium]